MRTSIPIATFLILGAGAAGAGALNNATLKGSDALFNTVQSVLASCPGATGLTYVGTGAGNGETNMKNGVQTINPTTNIIGTANGCTTGSANVTPSAEELLVIGLDGLPIVGSPTTAGTAACNGTDSDCDPTTQSNAGLAYSTTITLTDGTTYTFNGWRDVLRVLYAGFDHNATTIANRNCNSVLRQTLANNWGTLFQNSCSGGACTQLQHVFRRDDAAATTTFLLASLNLPAPNTTANTDPICNVIQTTDTLPANVNRYPADYQDNDPIRRKATGTNNGAVPANTPTEQVASRKGDLGLVLPIVATDQLALSASYPTTPCTTNTILAVNSAPRVINTAGSLQPSTSPGRCPNGDVPVLVNQCLIPVDANGNPNCLAAKNTKPSFIFDNTAVDSVTPLAADGRVYNQHLRLGGTNSNTSGTYQNDKNSPARPLEGAFVRLHQSRSLNATDATQNTCATAQTADLQIGCLVQASPCSIGYAGRDSITAGATPLKVSALDSTAACVEAFAYPLSRKVYLSTLIGFENVTGQELALAQCFTNPTLLNPALASGGFFQIPTAVSPSGTETYCEDFNEQQFCGAASNNNACSGGATDNAAVNLPTANTVCGNGVVEAYEDCDNGVGVNGAPPAQCSTTCRFNN